ncbi:hypothetical protein Sjap_018102 [Stephania japonica]|uniref:Uncharacterized protein n=1 Tax=Stephania japonica TaxID=461633 RepID=A0AAP0I7C7_9MAGN
MTVVVDVVMASKALPPKVQTRAYALKMADEVLQHLVTGGPVAPSGTNKSAGNESQTVSKTAEKCFIIKTQVNKNGNETFPHGKMEEVNWVFN